MSEWAMCFEASPRLHNLWCILFKYFGNWHDIMIRYIMMIDNANKVDRKKKYDSYRTMEEMALYECHKQPFENNQDIFDAFDFDQPYIADPDDPDSARITGIFI